MNVLIKSNSRGLFWLDEYLYHFVMKEIGNERIFGVELFDNAVEFLGFYEMERITLNLNPADGEEVENNIFRFIQDVDKEGNFYSRVRKEGQYGVDKFSIDRSMFK